MSPSLLRAIPCLLAILQLCACEQLYVDTARQSPRRSLAFSLDKKECPTTQIQQNFQTEDFLGRWYEMYRPLNQPYQQGDCNFANYSLKPDGILRVINSQRFKNKPGKFGDQGMAPQTAQGFSQGVIPIKNGQPAYSQKQAKTNIEMGLLPRPVKNKNMNQDYMYNERFGDIRWKYRDAQDQIFQYTQAEGMARKLEPEANDGRFQLKFSVFQPAWGNYHVLDTDYESYTVVYSCRTFLGGRGKNEYVWILSRNPLDVTVDSEEHARITNIAKNVMAKNVPGFDWDSTMYRTIQGTKNDCIYP